MKNLVIGNWTSWCLIVLCVLLFLVIIAEYENEIDAPVIAEPAVGSEVQMREESGLDIDTMRPQPNDIQVILERPPFTKGREPSQQTSSRTLPRTRPLRLSLEGIAITSEKRIAIIKDLGTNTRIQLEEGSEYKDWILDKVDTTSIIIKRGSQSHRLSLNP